MGLIYVHLELQDDKFETTIGLLKYPNLSKHLIKVLRHIVILVLFAAREKD